jgi:ABC-type dipeptide/oligopeptide/nickel transport system ATPase component
MVRDLAIRVRRGNEFAEVVHEVSFDVGEGEALALIGETGCGKTLTARAIMRALPPGAEASRGSVMFEGIELTELTEGQLRTIRATRIGMIMQNPRAALHPLRRVGDQMRSVMRAHGMSSKGPDEDALLHETLRAVQIADVERVAQAWPHELSGGMAQRVIIGIAMLGQPRLLIADEPTTGLDVTVQAQVLELIASHVDRLGASAIVVTHDLGIVAQYCRRAIVMDAGRIVEDGTVESLFRNPQSAYGKRLVEVARSERLTTGQTRVAAEVRGST